MKQSNIFRRTLALMGDMAFSFFTTWGILHLFKPPFHISYMESFLWGMALYFLLCQILLHRSIFQYLLQIQGNDRKAAWKHLVWKLLLIVFIPLVISQWYIVPIELLWEKFRSHFDCEIYCFECVYFGENNARMFLCLCCYALLFVCEILCFCICKKSLAEKLSGCLFIKTERPHAMAIVGTWTLALLLLAYPPLWKHMQDKGYDYAAHNLVQEFPPVPFFAKQHLSHTFRNVAMDPKTYLDGLFEKYDIVFIIERSHPDMVQWDFFSDYILNEDFARKVGYFCTEYGTAAQQAELDSLLNCPYADDTSALIAAASLIRASSTSWPIYTNRNIYDFSLKCREYNLAHDSSLQIRWFFNNMKDLGEQVHSYVEMLKEQCKIDSILGCGIARCHQWQLQHDSMRKKMLVIVNNLHGFSHIFEHYSTTIDYVKKAFPGKVGAAYLPSLNADNTFSTFQIAGDGLWDAAAKGIKTPFAMPLEGSGVENDFFTWTQSPSYREKIRWKDLFDGIIYLGPLKEEYWDENGFPYLFKDYAETFHKRCKNLQMEEFLEIEEYFMEHGDLGMPAHKFLLKSYNLMYERFYYLLLCMIGCALLFSSIQYVRQRMKAKA